MAARRPPGAGYGHPKNVRGVGGSQTRHRGRLFRDALRRLLVGDPGDCILVCPQEAGLFVLQSAHLVQKLAVAASLPGVEQKQRGNGQAQKGRRHASHGSPRGALPGPAVQGFLRNAKLGAAAGRVSGSLFLRGGNRLARDDAQLGFAPTLTDRPLRRARTVLTALPEEPLYDPVLQGMEGDNADPAARIQDPDGGAQSLLELIQLMVDRDPKGLERLRCGMNPAMAVGFGHRRADHLGQPGRGGNGRLLPLSGNPGNDGAGKALLAESKEDIGQLGRFGPVHQVGGGAWKIAPQPHVQGFIAVEGKASAAGLVVVSGDPEVHEDEVRGPFLRVASEERGIPPVHQAHPIGVGGETFPGDRENRRIGIHTSHLETRVALQECLRVPTLPYGGVDEKTAIRGRHELRKHFRRQDWLVDDHRTILPPSFSAASLNFASFADRYAW